MENNPPTEPTDKRNAGVNDGLAALIAAIKSEGQANRAEGQREGRAKILREWFTIGLIFLTCCLSLLQLNEMRKVYQPIKDQVTLTQKSLVATERPWLYFYNDVAPHSIGIANIYDILLANLSNRGNGLAIDVTIGGEIVALQEFEGIEQRADTDKIPCTSNTPPSRATSIPPHRDQQSLKFGVQIGPVLVPAAGARIAGNRYLAGCISYKWSSTDDVFHTYFLVPAHIYNSKTGGPQADGSGMEFVDPNALYFQIDSNAIVTYTDID